MCRSVAGRDDPYPCFLGAFLERVHDDYELPRLGQTECNPPFLALAVFVIVAAQCERVAKDGGCHPKAHTVPVPVGHRLAEVPVEPIDEALSHETAALQISSKSLSAVR